MSANIERLQEQREKIANRLWNETLWVESAKLRKCGSPLSLVCTSCGRIHETQQHCNRRYCPPCARTRANTLCDRYGPVVENLKWPLFLTLTQPRTPDDDAEFLLTRIKESVKRFRKLKWFTDKVAGGVGAIEVASGHSPGYHVHWHGILDCRWLSVTTHPPGRHLSKDAKRAIYQRAQKEIAHQWSLACRVESAGIYLRRASPDTIREVLKYSVSPEALLDRKNSIAELVIAMTGRHLVASWGSIRKLTKQLKDESTEDESGLPCECGNPCWDIVGPSGLPGHISI